VPINDYAKANELLAKLGTEEYYVCCGKAICGGCLDSFSKSGNIGTCPFCNAERIGKTEDEENIQEMMKRVEVNDAGAMYELGNNYYHGQKGLQQDGEKAMGLWKQAAKLGSSQAHFQLGAYYDDGGDLKKAKFHYEAAAMAGNEAARCNLGTMEAHSGDRERAVKHWMIAASAGDYTAMDTLIILLEAGHVSRDAIAPILTAYNNSCAEMRSEARDAYINMCIQHRGVI
jgi:TPR repeat protein